LILWFTADTNGSLCLVSTFGAETLKEHGLDTVHKIPFSLETNSSKCVLPNIGCKLPKLGNYGPWLGHQYGLHCVFLPFSSVPIWLNDLIGNSKEGVAMIMHLYWHHKRLPSCGQKG
jgi:hypothetical protein